MLGPGRLALATPFDGLAPATGTLAILAALRSRGWRVQHYGTRACLDDPERVRLATGLPGRHLDPWLMPPDLLRTVFGRSIGPADLAVVEGAMGAPVSLVKAPFGTPGDLAPVAQALRLPAVALLPAQTIDPAHLPGLDPRIEAVILDGLDPGERFDALREGFETWSHRPLLGAVPAMPAAREALADPNEAEEALDALARGFLQTAQLGRLRSLAARAPALGPVSDVEETCRRPFRVAYARDDAFTRYFPDTLETLEAVGAELVEFSPLHDETLPAHCDLLIFGCGYTERHAEALGANLSLILALREYVRQGRRVYAEGGGMAYLGREIVVGGRSFPVAGVFPFVAETLLDRPRPEPVSRRLRRPTWLGPAGTLVRGYQAGRWRLTPAPGLDGPPGPSGPLTSLGDMFFHHHAIGGLVHLQLAALPHVVSAFIHPRVPTPINRRS